MRRVTKVLKRDNFIPELGYLVVDSNGMTAYNGQIGIHYSRQTTGERLCSLADTNGAFGIPDPSQFLKTISVLESIASVELSKKESAITIRFAGKGILKIAVVLDLHAKIPHNDIKWKTYEDAKENGVEVSSLWREIEHLVTNEGEALWGEVIGVYGCEGKLVSFDYGVYLHSEGEKTPEFYCPRSILTLGLKNMDYAIVEGDIVYLVGKECQYVCTGVTKSEVVSEMMQLKDSFKAGVSKTVTLDFTSGLWKRAKLFASAVLTLKVRNGEIFVEHDTWSECIGQTEAPNAEFTTRISLLERWASGTLEHAISLVADGTWNLYGRTRGGMNFYAVLTDVYNPSIDSTSVDDTIDSDEIDIEEGESLL